MFLCGRFTEFIFFIVMSLTTLPIFNSSLFLWVTEQSLFLSCHVSFLVGSLEKKCRKFAFKSSLLASSQNNLPCKVNMRRPRAPPPPPVALLPSPFSHPLPTLLRPQVCLSQQVDKNVLSGAAGSLSKKTGQAVCFSRMSFLSLTFVLSRRETRAGARTHTYGYFSALRVTWRAEN